MEGCSDLLKVFDKNGDGRVTIAEIKEVLGAFSSGEITDASIRALVNTDGDTVDLKDLKNLMTKQAETANFSNLRKIYKSLDKDGDKKVSIDEFKGLLRSEDFKKLMKGELSDEDIDKIAKEVDSDNNGEISYEEFATAAFALFFKKAAEK